MSEILDLNTEEALPTVKIDGQAYPLRMDAEYAELLRLRNIGKRIQQVSEADERTEQEEAELRTLMRNEVRAVLRAPDAVLDKLTDFQRFRIVAAFNDLVSEATTGPTKAATKTPPGSDGSTAAR